MGRHSSDVSPLVRAALLTHCAYLEIVSGTHASATDHLNEALKLHRQLGDERGISSDQSYLGHIANIQGDYKRARTCFEEALSIQQGRGDLPGVSIALNNLGNTAFYQGEYPLARDLYEQSLKLKRRIGHPKGIATAMHNLAMVCDHLGEFEEAAALYEENLAIFREMGDRRGIGATLIGMAQTANWMHDYERARSCAEEALPLLQEIGDKQRLGDCFGQLGQALRSTSPREATQVLEQSIGFYVEIKDRRGIATSREHRGLAFANLAEFPAAAGELRDALSVREEVGELSGIADALAAIAHLAARAGYHVDAVRIWGALDALAAAISQSHPALGAQGAGERDALRVRVGAEAFELAWTAARQWTPPQAVRAAFDILDRI